jgi:Acetyltransferase (GNAT) domain
MKSYATAEASFRVLEASGPSREEWLALLESWSGREVFAHPDYLALYQTAGQRPICVVYRSSEGQVVYPLLIRDLRATTFWGPDGDELYDTIAPPYGYGGPFVEGGGDKKDLVVKFFREYSQWALSQNVISEYVTFSPKEECELPYPGTVTYRAPTVVRTLTPYPDEIWRGYTGSVRRSVQAARRAGLVIEADQSGERIKDFLEIYTETMMRRNAAANYYLSPGFLEYLNRNLKGYYVYFHALLGGKVVSTELVLISADSIFFFRGGTRADASQLRSNHLLKHHIMLWGQEKGKSYYLLGGGNTAEDSLYQYKLSFAPQGIRDLRIGKWILNQARYEQLIAVRRSYEKAKGAEWMPQNNYFPAYRAPSE